MSAHIEGLCPGATSHDLTGLLSPKSHLGARASSSCASEVSNSMSPQMPTPAAIQHGTIWRFRGAVSVSLQFLCLNKRLAATQMDQAELDVCLATLGVGLRHFAFFA
jgi:hypothetical protein